MAPVVEWAKLTWPEAQEAVARMPACLVPFGAVEAHGPHMSLETDTLLAGEVCRRVCERTGAILMPTVPYGQVWSLYRLPGTLSMSIYTLIAFTRDLVKSLADHGFRLVLLHSAHVGNLVGLRQAIRECYEEIPGVKVVLLDRLAPALRDVSDVLTTPRSHPYYLHACEIETSMTLEVAPGSVDMSRAVREYPDYPFDFDATPTYWDVVTKSGVLGDATAASPEKGRAIVGRLVDLMVEVAEQEVRQVCS